MPPLCSATHMYIFTLKRVWCLWRLSKLRIRHVDHSAVFSAQLITHMQNLFFSLLWKSVCVRFEVISALTPHTWRFLYLCTHIHTYLYSVKLPVGDFLFRFVFGCFLCHKDSFALSMDAIWNSHFGVVGLCSLIYELYGSSKSEGW